MRTAVAFLSTLMLIFGMFAFATPPARAPGNAPQWQNGDYWHYAGHGYVYPWNYAATLNLTVSGVQSFTGTNGSYDAYRCEFLMSVIVGDVAATQHGDTYLRTSDLAVVAVIFSISSIYGSYDSDSRYDPPIRQLQFPLDAGQHWYGYVRETNSGENHYWDFNVTGPQTVNVAAGSFNTFVVHGYDATMGASAEYYNETVGFLVRTRALFLGTLFPVELDLQSYGHGGNNPEGLPIVLVLVVALIAVVVVALVASVLIRRRRARIPAPPMSPLGVQPPYQPPRQPPSGPPW